MDEIDRWDREDGIERKEERREGSECGLGDTVR